MSDQKLRELERRWRSTGSPDDEVAYVLERVRVGDVSRERLELAAHFRYRPAEQALGLTLEPPVEPIDLVERTRALDHRRAVIAALAAAESCMELWRATFPADLTQRRTLDAVADWIACPCDSHRDGVRRVVDDRETIDARVRSRRDGQHIGPDVRAAGAVFHTAQAVLREGREAILVVGYAAEVHESRPMHGPVRSPATATAIGRALVLGATHGQRE